MDEVAERRAKIAQLHLRGWTQQRIAKEVGVTQGQVSQDLAEIRKQWQASTVTDYNQAKIEHLQRIENLFMIAMDAYHDSTKPLKKKSTRMKGDAAPAGLTDEEKKKLKPKALETQEFTEERLPDPRYLQVAHQQLEHLSKIGGFEAPLKIAETDPEGNPAKKQATNVVMIIDTTGGRKSPAPDDDYGAEQS